VFTTGKPKSTGEDQKDPSATPVATSLGLPKGDLEPQIPHPPRLEPVTASEADTIPIPTITQSPSISISTLSDFTIADTSDDEFPIDPTTITPHSTFYLEDDSVEVLCGNTLFRVHTSILSFHSPALRRMFSQTNLASAESPNGCPRILSSDSATDFATLLKMIYLPGYVTLHCADKLFRLQTLSTDSLNGTKYRISLHSHPSCELHPSTSCPLYNLSYSKWSVMHIQRPSRGSLLPSHSARTSSVGQPLTRTRSSTCSSSRSSHPHFRWHTTWQPEGE